MTSSDWCAAAGEDVSNEAGRKKKRDSVDGAEGKP